MVFRCELCDSFLPLLQLSHLCPNCYKIRTIVKCYDKTKILECLENNFLIDKQENYLKKKKNNMIEEDNGDYYDNNFKKEFREELNRKIDEHIKKFS